MLRSSTQVIKRSINVLTPSSIVSTKSKRKSLRINSLLRLSWCFPHAMSRFHEMMTRHLSPTTILHQSPLREVHSFSPEATHCIIVAESWPSWLAPLMARNFQPLIIFCLSRKIPSIFLAIPRHIWRHHSRLRSFHADESTR